MAGIPTNPVILQELDATHFSHGDIKPNLITLKVSSTSPVAVTEASDGLVFTAPTVAPTTNTISYDAVGKTLTSTVDGVAAVTDLSGLDDEGVQIRLNAGSLELVSASGTVLSSTPLADVDAQTLSVAGGSLTIARGNSVPLSDIVNATTIDAVYAAAPVPATSTSLVYGPGGVSYSIKPIQSAFGTVLFNAIA